MLSETTEKKDQFVGPKKIKRTQETGEKTPGGFPIIAVEYESGQVEHFSAPMLEKSLTSEAIDETKLRDKRIFPVVESLLILLRDWGLKLGELDYTVRLLSQSLNMNTDAATKELWSQWMPKPLSLDDIDLITVDRVLRSQRVTLEDVMGKEK